MTDTPDKKKRKRKPTQFMLAWVTESQPVKDDAGQPIPGTERRCYVELDLPPGLDASDKRSRAAIKRACKKAVYEDGLTEFGNKALTVISRDDIFTVDYEKVSVTRLLPPDKAERVRAQNGKVGPSLIDAEDEIEEEDEDEDEDEVEESETESVGNSEPATSAT